jgi:hypothetical protein
VARLALALLALGTACRAPAPPSNAKAPDAGVSIALYAGGEAGYGVVDDRRWVDIAGPTLLLPNIDPGAELASLVIEPASPALRVGACTRERMPEYPRKDPLEEHAAQQRAQRHKPVEPAPSDRFLPVVLCEVRAKPGRYLVRLLYITKALGYRAQHDVEVTDATHAQITSRFAITTPVWQTRAELVLYDGIPGGERSPREVGRGQVTLDGSTSVIATPPRQVASQLRRIYEGAVVTTGDSTELEWGRDSVQAIWVWLELAKVQIPHGPVHVHIDLPGEGIRDLDIPHTSRKQDDVIDAPLRLPLWVDEALRGSRVRITEFNDGASISERYIFSVANTGETARDVWVEEPMRKASKRKVDRAWPKKPSADRDVLRTKLDVRPGRMERTGYTLTYDF